MRHIKSLLFIGILFLLAYLIYYIIGKDLSDTNNVSFDFNDEKIVNSAIDSISHIEHVIDTMGNILPVYATQVEDFEAKADINTDFIHFQIIQFMN
jgi:sporulation protein YlmC with PRC-barrel domain